MFEVDDKVVAGEDGKKDGVDGIDEGGYDHEDVDGEDYVFAVDDATNIIPAKEFEHQMITL